MTSWQYYLVISCIIAFISWLGCLEYRVRHLQSRLNMANWENEKTDIDTAVKQLTSGQRKSELLKDLGSGPNTSPSS